MQKKWIAILTITLVLVIDQASKIWVKTHILYGDGFDMFGLPWAKIHFIENEGMAFGLSYGGLTGKYILSIFRILMAGFLIYLLKNILEKKEPTGFIVAFSLVIAGAVGNIIDSMFYGLIFSESYFHGGLATLFPQEGGYGSFLTGKVVDMFYFPMFEITWPEWIPLIGGDRFEFFRHVFNVADSSIFCGVVSIILFYRSFFKAEENNSKTLSSDEMRENEEIHESTEPFSSETSGQETKDENPS
ncbi:MAG: lipoprotein signal peptidase [Saprospiraceae bacterium]|nr:lipoprotein signal peptidase [Saprospiraceae bacterium]MBK8818349.1 lipoprotein signal peptidase [Saprospiraceae bacterium]MBK8854280.1 lipoprotein signal peptidase [Saprospiraceae bacterium]